MRKLFLIILLTFIYSQDEFQYNYSNSFSAYLFYLVNSITAFIAFLTIFTYVFIYTPSKTKSKWNTIIGSFPGALPPVGGWTAATGEIQIPALILFLVLFCWQMPHFLSLAIIYKDDYKKAGFKMLPSISQNLDSTLFQIIGEVCIVLNIPDVIFDLSLHITSCLFEIPNAFTQPPG